MSPLIVLQNDKCYHTVDIDIFMRLTTKYKRCIPKRWVGPIVYYATQPLCVYETSQPYGVAC